MTLISVLLKTILPFTIGSSVLLVLSQFFGRISKLRLLIVLILVDFAYLKYHLYLLSTQELLNKAHHFLAFIPALLLLGALLLLSLDLSLKIKRRKNHYLLSLSPFIVSATIVLCFHQRIEDKTSIIQNLYQFKSISIYSIAGVLTITVFTCFLYQINSELKKNKIPIKANSMQILILSSLISAIIFTHIMGSLIIIQVITLIIFLLYSSFLAYYIRHPHFLNKVFQKKAKKSQIENVAVEKKVKKLLFLLDEEKIYKDPMLNLNKIAKELGLTSHQTSELINKKLQKSFKKLINSYRINEAKVILKSKPEITTLSIAYELGFNSYTSFYQQFKAFTGLTPNSYRNKHSK